MINHAVRIARTSRIAAFLVVAAYMWIGLWSSFAHVHGLAYQPAAHEVVDQPGHEKHHSDSQCPACLLIKSSAATGVSAAVSVTLVPSSGAVKPLVTPTLQSVITPDIPRAPPA
ncbi:MAG: DUF2946 family protein [Armatimonadetes bacterium]|nr:DUF2946 family protein [Armatimonadota bacterium]